MLMKTKRRLTFDDAVCDEEEEVVTGEGAEHSSQTRHHKPCQADPPHTERLGQGATQQGWNGTQVETDVAGE